MYGRFDIIYDIIFFSWKTRFCGDLEIISLENGKLSGFPAKKIISRTF
jgi:hypothetical protein